MFEPTPQIGTILADIASNYPSITTRKSTIDLGKTWLRVDVPAALREHCGLSDDLEIKASGGMSRAADVPWIGIRRNDITSSFMHGIYIAYLFAADLKYVFLSLQLGVTHLEGSGAVVDRRPSPSDLPLLLARARGLRSIWVIPERFQTYEIDLNPNQPRSRAYQAGHIIGTRYAVGQLPDEATLEEDLHELLAFYRTIIGDEFQSANILDRGEIRMAPERDFRDWTNREKSGASAAIDVEAWRQAIERRIESHEILLTRIATFAKRHGLSIKNTRHIDMVVNSRIMIEAKSVSNDAVSQARAALAQLFMYRFAYRERYPGAILVAAFDEPLSSGGGLEAFLDECGIAVAWAVGDAFRGTDRARRELPWMFD